MGITDLLSNLVTGTFIIEKQPAQVSLLPSCWWASTTYLLTWVTWGMTPSGLHGLHQAAASGSLCFRYAFRRSLCIFQYWWNFVPVFRYPLREEMFFHFQLWCWDPLVQQIRCCPGHSFSITRHFKPSVTFPSVFSTQDTVHLLHV